MARIYDAVQKAAKPVKVTKKRRTAAPSQRVMAPVTEVVTHGEVDRKVAHMDHAALDDPVEPAAPVSKKVVPPPIEIGPDILTVGGHSSPPEGTVIFQSVTSVLVRLPDTLVERLERTRVKLGLRSRNQTIERLLHEGAEK